MDISKKDKQLKQDIEKNMNRQEKEKRAIRVVHCMVAVLIVYIVVFLVTCIPNYRNTINYLNGVAFEEYAKQQMNIEFFGDYTILSSEKKYATGPYQEHNPPLKSIVYLVRAGSGRLWKTSVRQGHGWLDFSYGSVPVD